MEKNVTKTKAWKKLALHYRFFKNVEMKNLFAFDAKRGSKYAVELGPLYLDYSKNRFNEKTLQYLLELADEVKLRDKIEAMFTGEKSILPKTGRFCIRLCAIVRTRRYMSTAKT